MSIRVVEYVEKSELRKSLEEKYGIKLNSVVQGNIIEEFDLAPTGTTRTRVYPAVVLLSPYTGEFLGAIEGIVAKNTNFVAAQALVRAKRGPLTYETFLPIHRVITGEFITVLRGCYYVLQSLPGWRREYLDIDSFR